MSNFDVLALHNKRAVVFPSHEWWARSLVTSGGHACSNGMRCERSVGSESHAPFLRGASQRVEQGVLHLLQDDRLSEGTRASLSPPSLNWWRRAMTELRPPIGSKASNELMARVAREVLVGHGICRPPRNKKSGRP